MNTETLNERKFNLIVRITKLDKEAVQKIEETVDIVEKQPTEKQLDMLKQIGKPIKKKIDLEELKREQNWKPSTNEEIKEILKDFNWEISDEEFLKILKDD